eukprot:c42276_g1_i1 orf=2-184(-)
MESPRKEDMVEEHLYNVAEEMGHDVVWDNKTACWSKKRHCQEHCGELCSKFSVKTYDGHAV